MERKIIKPTRIRGRGNLKPLFTGQIDDTTIPNKFCKITKGVGYTRDKVKLPSFTMSPEGEPAQLLVQAYKIIEEDLIKKSNYNKVYGVDYLVNQDKTLVCTNDTNTVCTYTLNKALKKDCTIQIDFNLSSTSSTFYAWINDSLTDYTTRSLTMFRATNSTTSYYCTEVIDGITNNRAYPNTTFVKTNNNTLIIEIKDGIPTYTLINPDGVAQSYSSTRPAIETPYLTFRVSNGTCTISNIKYTYDSNPANSPLRLRSNTKVHFLCTLQSQPKDNQGNVITEDIEPLRAHKIFMYETDGTYLSSELTDNNGQCIFTYSNDNDGNNYVYFNSQYENGYNQANARFNYFVYYEPIMKITPANSVMTHDDTKEFTISLIDPNKESMRQRTIKLYENRPEVLLATLKTDMAGYATYKWSENNKEHNSRVIVDDFQIYAYSYNYISGQLIDDDVDGDVGLDNCRVLLYIDDENVSRTGVITTKNGNGFFTLKFLLEDEKVHDYTIVFPGNDDYNPDSSTTFTVRPKRKATLSLISSKSQQIVGESITLSGKLSGVKYQGKSYDWGNKQIRLYGSDNKDYGTITTNADGSFSVTQKSPSAPSSVDITATWPGDNIYHPATASIQQEWAYHNMSLVFNDTNTQLDYAQQYNIVVNVRDENNNSVQSTVQETYYLYEIVDNKRTLVDTIRTSANASISSITFTYTPRQANKTYQLQVSHPHSTRWSDASTTKTVTCKKKISQITLTESTITITRNDEFTIHGVLEDVSTLTPVGIANETVSVTLGSSVRGTVQTSSDGTFTYTGTFSILNATGYNLVFKFAGNETYDSCTSQAINIIVVEDPPANFHLGGTTASGSADGTIIYMKENQRSTHIYIYDDMYDNGDNIDGKINLQVYDSTSKTWSNIVAKFTPTWTTRNGVRYVDYSLTDFSSLHLGENKIRAQLVEDSHYVTSYSNETYLKIARDFVITVESNILNVRVEENLGFAGTVTGVYGEPYNGIIYFDFVVNSGNSQQSGPVNGHYAQANVVNGVYLFNFYFPTEYKQRGNTAYLHCSDSNHNILTVIPVTLNYVKQTLNPTIETLYHLKGTNMTSIRPVALPSGSSECDASITVYDTDNSTVLFTRSSKTTDGTVNFTSNPYLFSSIAEHRFTVSYTNSDEYENYTGSGTIHVIQNQTLSIVEHQRVFSNTPYTLTGSATNIYGNPSDGEQIGVEGVGDLTSVTTSQGLYNIAIPSNLIVYTPTETNMIVNSVYNPSHAPSSVSKTTNLHVDPAFPVMVYWNNSDSTYQHLTSLSGITDVIFNIVDTSTISSFMNAITQIDSTFLSRVRILIAINPDEYLDDLQEDPTLLTDLLNDLNNDPIMQYVKGFVYNNWWFDEADNDGTTNWNTAKSMYTTAHQWIKSNYPSALEMVEVYPIRSTAINHGSNYVYFMRNSDYIVPVYTPYLVGASSNSIDVYESQINYLRSHITSYQLNSKCIVPRISINNDGGTINPNWYLTDAMAGLNEYGGNGIILSDPPFESTPTGLVTNRVQRFRLTITNTTLNPDDILQNGLQIKHVTRGQGFLEYGGFTVTLDGQYLSDSNSTLVYLNEDSTGNAYTGWRCAGRQYTTIYPDLTGFSSGTHTLRIQYMGGKGSYAWYRVPSLGYTLTYSDYEVTINPRASVEYGLGTDNPWTADNTLNPVWHSGLQGALATNYTKQSTGTTVNLPLTGDFEITFKLNVTGNVGTGWFALYDGQTNVVEVNMNNTLNGSTINTVFPNPDTGYNMNTETYTLKREGTTYTYKHGNETRTLTINNTNPLYLKMRKTGNADMFITTMSVTGGGQ